MSPFFGAEEGAFHTYIIKRVVMYGMAGNTMKMNYS